MNYDNFQSTLIKKRIIPNKVNSDESNQALNLDKNENQSAQEDTHKIIVKDLNFYY